VNWARLSGYRVPVDGFKKRSFIYRKGWRVEKIVDTTHHWVCKECHKKKSSKTHIFSMKRATSGAVAHLKDIHLLTEEGPVMKKRRIGDGAMEAFANGGVGNGGDPVQAAQNEQATEFDSAEFKRLLYDWIITDSISFNELNSEKLRALLIYTNPRCKPAIPDRRTVSDTIGRIYDKAQGNITETLGRAATRINFSFDLWTSGNKLALLGVVGSFINDAGTSITTLLSLPRLHGKHSGFNMAESVGAVISEYGLKEKIGYFITDNAYSNGTCLDYLATEFGFDRDERWIRCVGHILNLVAQAVLFGTDETAFEDDLANHTLEELQLKAWRKRGPLGKLHNLIYWICRSPQRNERLMELQAIYVAPFKPEMKKELYELVKDVTTRWNSFDDAATRALYLRAAIDELMMEEEVKYNELAARQRRNPRIKKIDQPPAILEDRLSDEDWHVIALYHDILQPIKKATLDLQGHAGGRHGAIWRVIEIFEDLLTHFEKLRTQYPVRETLARPTARKQRLEDQRQSQLSFTATQPDVASQVLDIPNDQATFEHHLSTNINAGWQKLELYYYKLDDSPVYVAAVVLHPRMKWRSLEKRWLPAHPEWINKAKIAFTKLSQRYQHYAGEAPEAPPKHVGLSIDEDDVLSDDDEGSGAATSIEQQLISYMSESRSTSIMKKDSPVPYWLAQKRRWPQLSAMALDVYSTPVMSDEPERVFSEVGAALGTRRRLLSADSMKFTQCLKSWIRTGVIDFTRYAQVTPLPLTSAADDDDRGLFEPSWMTATPSAPISATPAAATTIGSSDIAAVTVD